MNILIAIAVLVVGYLLYWIKNEELKFFISSHNTYSDRYFVTITQIYKTEKKEEEFSDPEIRRLMGKEEVETPTLNVRLCVDLEEVSSFSEWTTGAKDEQGRCYSDSTMLFFKDGSSAIVLEEFEVVEDAFVSYLNNREYGARRKR